MGLLVAIAFAAACGVATGGPPPNVAFLSHGDLVEDGEAAREAIRAAFTGSASFGLLVVRGIPGFADKRRAAFNATMRLAVDPPVHSRRLRNAWPGFRHPSDVQEPLQGGFLHNMLEDVGPARVDPVFGKTPWPDAAYRATVVAMNELIYDTSHRVLSGVDRLEGP